MCGDVNSCLCLAGSQGLGNFMSPCIKSITRLMLKKMLRGIVWLACLQAGGAVVAMLLHATMIKFLPT